MVEMLGRTEEGEILMVGEDLDWERRAMEVMSPSFEGVDDGKEFVIIDVIITLSWWKRLGEIRTGVPVTIRVSLKK